MNVFLKTQRSSIVWLTLFFTFLTLFPNTILGQETAVQTDELKDVVVNGQLPVIKQVVNPNVSQLWLPVGIYSLFIMSASLFGGWILGKVEISHLRFQLLLSLVGGLLLGVGIFHLLPHAIQELGINQVHSVAFWMMAGILLMFFLLRAFHVHHHEPTPTSHPRKEDRTQHNHSDDKERLDTHQNHSHCGGDHDHCQPPESGLGWAGLFFGLAIHTLLDGVALGAAMQADLLHGVGLLAGLGVFFGIALHKPLDSLSITALMAEAGCSKKLQWSANLFYAILCPIGIVLFLIGIASTGAIAHHVIGCSLAFSAGIFICIALADLLPEMEFHTHHRGHLSIALIIGIALAWAIQFLEPAHLH